MAIGNWQDLFDHIGHKIEPEEDTGSVVCLTCVEVLAGAHTHDPEKVEILATYYTVAEASLVWPDVKRAFPHPDDEPEPDEEPVEASTAEGTE